MNMPIKHSWEGKITGRPIRSGDRCESSWPPAFGTGDTTPMHINRETGKVEPGYPKPTQKHGEAPAIIADTLNEPFYHHGVCRVVDTRSGLHAADRESGCITTDKLQEADKSIHTKRAKALREDAREALNKSVAQLDAGTAPLTEEQRAACERRNEVIAAALPGLDPFNAAGRISNAKGKRYKRKRKH